MELELFQSLLAAPRRTQSELVTMRDNALSQNALGHVHAAEVALDQRFPGWRDVRTRRGGPKPTDVEFGGRKAHFNSEKEGYIWLLERFIQYYPKPFVDLDWETAFVAKGPRALFFTKSLRRLFGEQGQHLAADRNKWCRLSNNWYAKLVLSESQKLGLLTKFAIVARLRYGVEWDWNGEGQLSLKRSACDLLAEMSATPL